MNYVMCLFWLLVMYFESWFYVLSVERKSNDVNETSDIRVFVRYLLLLKFVIKNRCSRHKWNQTMRL
ncbi:hypothetical protein C0J52_25437 [Blattella germanica]|nr:hypothetical protein C0J52_25437 [Blattella germanica]